MSNYKCKSSPETIHAFIGCVGNNWRNAAFIQCSVCKHEKTEACGNFLFTVTREGKPVLIPEKDADVIFGRLVDMSECIFTISNVRFMELYRLWLENNSTCVHPCRLLQQVLVSV